MKKFPAPVLPVRHSRAHSHSPSLPDTNYEPTACRLARATRRRDPKAEGHSRGTGPAALPAVLPAPPWQRFADSTARVWQPHNGASRSRSDCRPPRKPFPPFPTRPKVHPRQVGPGRRCPATSAAFASGQHPAPSHTRAPDQGRPAGPRRALGPAAVSGCRLAGSLAPAPLRIAARARGRRDEAARAAAPRGRPGTRRRRPGPGKSRFSRGPRARCPAEPARRRGGERELPSCRPRGAALRSPSPRSSPASARRAHTGARLRTLTRAAHSRRLRPHPCAKEPRAPRTRQGLHPVH